MLLYDSRVHLFSLLSNIPLYQYTKICLFIYPLMDIWVVSSFGLLQIKLLGNHYIHGSLCRHMFPFLLGR